MQQNDPNTGLFRLWSIYQIDERLKDQSTHDSMDVDDLVVDHANRRYFRIAAFNGRDPILEPWQISNNSSYMNVILRNTQAYYRESEYHRIYFDDDTIFIPYQYHFNQGHVSHYRLYRDPDLRESISRGNGLTDFVQLGEVGRVIQKLHDGDTIFYVLYDTSENVLSIVPLITECIWNQYYRFEERPIDVSLISRFINPSDPRVIDLRGSDYIEEDDLIARVAYRDRVEEIKVDGVQVVLNGLIETFYSGLGWGKASLKYVLNASSTAALVREYVVLTDADETLPEVEKLPEPPRVDVYLTSTNYDLGYEEEDAIEDSAEVLGEVMSIIDIYSTSSPYPHNDFDSVASLPSVSRIYQRTMVKRTESEFEEISSLPAVNSITMRAMVKRSNTESENIGSSPTVSRIEIRSIVKRQSVDSEVISSAPAVTGIRLERIVVRSNSSEIIEAVPSVSAIRVFIP